MKLGSKNKLALLVMILLCGVQFSVGYSIFIQGNEHTSSNINTSVGNVVDINKAISITNDSKFEYGKYFFNINGTHSKEATLNYKFSINKQYLPTNVIVDNANGGFDLKLKCLLQLSNYAEIFNDNTYCTNVSFNNESITPLYNGTNISLDLTFKTTSKENLVYESSLMFTFSNKIILKKANEIKNQFFELSVNYGEIR